MILINYLPIRNSQDKDGGVLHLRDIMDILVGKSWKIKELVGHFCSSVVVESSA